MKQLIKVSLLFTVLFLTIPVYAEGDMGAGGRPPVKTAQKAPESIVNNKSLDSSNGEKDALGNLFSWVYQQIFELIG